MRDRHYRLERVGTRDAARKSLRRIRVKRAPHDFDSTKHPEQSRRRDLRRFGRDIQVLGSQSIEQTTRGSVRGQDSEIRNLARDRLSDRVRNQADVAPCFSVHIGCGIRDSIRRPAQQRGCIAGPLGQPAVHCSSYRRRSLNRGPPLHPLDGHCAFP